MGAPGPDDDVNPRRGCPRSLAFGDRGWSVRAGVLSRRVPPVPSFWGPGMERSSRGSLKAILQRITLPWRTLPIGRNFEALLESGAMRSPARNPAANPATPSQGNREIPPCAPVNSSQPNYVQQLARQHSVPVQDKYSSIASLKPIISEALQATRQIVHFHRCMHVKLSAAYAEIE